MGDGLPHHEGGNKKESKAETEVPISVFEATAALENWETARKEAGINRRQAAALLKDRTLAEEPLDTILTKLAEEESRLTSTLSEIQRLNEKTVECEAHSRTLTLQRTSLENHNLHLAPGDAKPTTIPEWEALLESMASRNAKYDSLNTECNTLRREHAGYDEEIERIENEPAASPTSTLDPEEDKKIKDAPTHELQAEIKQLSEAILAARKNRQTRQVKEKELSGMEAKLESARATSKGASDSLEQIESELEQGCNIPLHPNLTATSLTSTSTSPSTPPSTGGVTHTPNRETLKELHSKSVSLWEHHLSEKRRLTAVLESLPEQIQSSKQELDGMRSLLETAEKETQRVAAARKLVNFLDYKNAPRKLLQNITERIFKTANEIAENLHVDIRLIVGKNLEFLTQQCRNGKWIEQKTERLGHGKGAMLGICFRLACQKLLLPETGFLILDEPTANVDIKRKSALKAFLQSLGEETESRARQIILIEHDVDVIELCQAKIHVGELANNTNPSANSDPNPNPNFNSNSNHPELP
jgi:DNA repair exonuclease SbcCD ATPase subunit